MPTDKPLNRRQRFARPSAIHNNPHPHTTLTSNTVICHPCSTRIHRQRSTSSSTNDDQILIPYQPSILPTFFHPYTPHPSSSSPPVPSPSLTQTRTQNKKHNLQLPLQPRLKPLLTPHRPTNHGHNNKLTSRLSTHRHWRIDGDAHCEGGGEGGEACWRHCGGIKSGVMKCCGKERGGLDLYKVD
jgi:hypothetical protein